MARSLKKGPFADKKCIRTEAGYQDLVPSFYNFPFFCGTYNCST